MSAAADKVLEEIRQRYEYASDSWEDIRQEARTDMQYVAGDPWTEDDKQARKNRPMIAPEEMGQYFNAVINELRSNPRGMKFTPQGNGANDEGAEFYQDKFREIEYRSHAKIAYIAAAENAIQRSYGFCRVTTRYASDRTSNQEIWIDDIPNPDMVMPDPDAKRPDSSDMKYCFVLEWRDRDEFQRTHPDAKLHDFDGFAGETWYQKWFTDRKILLAEYWTITTTTKRLLQVQLPAPAVSVGQTAAPAPAPIEILEDDFASLPPGAKVLRVSRTVDVPKVMQYLTNGAEILSTTEWPGKYIPIVSCYGKVIYVDEGAGTRRKMLSMTRFGRAPWKLLCYIASQMSEVVGMTPKVPVIGYKGQFREVETNWQRAPHEPLAYLEAQFTVEGAPPGTVLPLPHRLEYSASEHLQGLMLLYEAMRRAIQAAMGSNFLPTQAQRRNEKSGVALEEIKKSAQMGTFHFVDHFDDLVRQVGVICEDLIDKIYDTAREVGTQTAAGDAKMVRVNDPTHRNEQGEPAYVSTKGDYLGTVSTGPSFESEREAASDFADTLAQNPQVFPLVGDLIVKLKNLGPIGDELAERLHAMLPPALQKPKDGSAPPSPELQQALQQVQQLQGVVQELGQKLQTDQIKVDSNERIAGAKIASEEKMAAMDRETKLGVAELGAKVDRLELFLEERARVGAQIGDQRHEAIQNEHDRQHEAAISDLEHRQAMQQGQQAHDQQMEAGEQGQMHALEQGQQAADLAPEPAAGA